MSQQSKLRSTASKIFWLVAFILTLAVAFLLQHPVRDTVIGASYNPPQSVEAIESRLQLTNSGTRIFAATQPKLMAGEEFTETCENIEKSSVVLGCYVSQQVILFDVSRTELDGIKEVTAAHELLHAAYDRLLFFEKPQIKELLIAEEARLQADEAFVERMSVYDSLSREDQINELHSVLATEIRDISPELEQYYERYFTERNAVVELYESYQSVFSELRQETERLVAQLDRAASTINELSAQYDTDRAALEGDIQSFNARADAQQFDSVAEFNFERNELVRRSNALEQQRININNRIASYEATLARYDDLAVQLSGLNQSIDSKIEQPLEGVQ